MSHERGRERGNVPEQYGRGRAVIGGNGRVRMMDKKGERKECSYGVHVQGEDEKNYARRETAQTGTPGEDGLIHQMNRHEQ